VLEDYLLINAVVHTREVPFLKFVGVENISIEARVTTTVIGEMKDDSDRSRIFLRTFATVTDYVYFHIIHCFVPFLVGVTTVYQRFEFLSRTFLNFYEKTFFFQKVVDIYYQFCYIIFMQITKDDYKKVIIRKPTDD
jgi:hypothetical protein